MADQVPSHPGTQLATTCSRKNSNSPLYGHLDTQRKTNNEHFNHYVQGNAQGKATFRAEKCLAPLRENHATTHCDATMKHGGPSPQPPRHAIGTSIRFDSHCSPNIKENTYNQSRNHNETWRTKSPATRAHNGPRHALRKQQEDTVRSHRHTKENKKRASTSATTCKATLRAEKCLASLRENHATPHSDATMKHGGPSPQPPRHAIGTSIRFDSHCSPNIKENTYNQSRNHNETWRTKSPATRAHNWQRHALGKTATAHCTVTSTHKGKQTAST